MPCTAAAADRLHTMLLSSALRFSAKAVAVQRSETAQLSDCIVTVPRGALNARSAPYASTRCLRSLPPFGLDGAAVAAAKSAERSAETVAFWVAAWTKSWVTSARMVDRAAAIADIWTVIVDIERDLETHIRHALTAQHQIRMANAHQPRQQTGCNGGGGEEDGGCSSDMLVQCQRCPHIELITSWFAASDEVCAAI